MNPVSNTAYYCCGVRMEDAKKSYSICNDDFAERFMDDKGMQVFEPFKSEKMPNISNITRCRLIDDYLRSELSKNNSICIITIGAGFDTRPYRFSGGDWIEIDEPQIISYKNAKLPIEECANSLNRISIDFAQESLVEKLKGIDIGDHIVVVIEGVFMYLELEAIEDTINAIQEVAPKHELYCDLMTKRFFNKFAQSVHEKLVSAGGQFTNRPDFPESIFIQHGYKLIDRVPMFKRARDLGILWDEVKIPKFLSSLLLNFLVKDLAGYAVHRFHYEKKLKIN
jgi:methyltransferase (TIGR00027 family)